jgi:MFS transporter, DHA2 family, multidrug resistance protein
MRKTSQPLALDGPLVPLVGGQLWFAALMLAMANFMAVLNLSVANVAVPSISGSLGAAASQGTWVITAYAIGEAITVPLTGWLSARFGAMRVFFMSMVLFGIFSAICGLSPSIGALVVARVCQGLCGGPLMPLSQTLLLRIFPKEKAGAAIGMWSMTTLVAPVAGPIVGGYLCDEYSWAWAFVLNTPIALTCAFFGWPLLKRYTDTLTKSKIDSIGLMLLVLWVGALQLMLDEGKNLDWFSSGHIVALAVTAVVGFLAFLIWEWYEEDPIVNLRVFRYRGFTVAVLTVAVAYAAFFGAGVLTPLWLQSYMGYTATNSGFVTAWSGITAFLVSPFVARLTGKVDARKLVSAGLVWLGCVVLWRAHAMTEMGFWDIALPFVAMGVGLPFFFVPNTGLALGSVEASEVASAAGIMSFLRTLAGAAATSLVSTAWDNKITYNHAELIGLSDADGATRATLQGSGMTVDAVNQSLDSLITAQSVMLSTNQVMALVAFAFFLGAVIIWLAPKPTRSIGAGAGGH